MESTDPYELRRKIGPQDFPNSDCQLPKNRGRLNAPLPSQNPTMPLKQATINATLARQLMRETSNGVLCSMSQDMLGYPLGSVTPFVLTHEATPVVYVSSIAQHTSNMLADPHVCLTVRAEGVDDAQAAGRVSVIGDARALNAEDSTELESRYFALFPDAKAYAGTHDFAFFAIVPRRVRYIGGFGKIFWVEAEQWGLPRPEWASEESDVVSHMNRDHADALIRMSGQKAAAELVTVDAEGCHLRVAGAIRYIPFPEPCLTMDSLRTAMITLARR